MRNDFGKSLGLLDPSIYLEFCRQLVDQLFTRLTSSSFRESFPELRWASSSGNQRPRRPGVLHIPARTPDAKQIGMIHPAQEQVFIDPGSQGNLPSVLFRSGSFKKIFNRFNSCFPELLCIGFPDVFDIAWSSLPSVACEYDR